MEDNSLCLLTFAGRVAEFNNTSLCILNSVMLALLKSLQKQDWVLYHVVISPHHTCTPLLIEMCYPCAYLPLCMECEVEDSQAIV